MTDVDSLHTAFIDTLVGNGHLRDSNLLTAFRNIRRGNFVPYYFAQSPSRSGWVLVESPTFQWAEKVYSNTPLITQLNGDDSLTRSPAKDTWSMASPPRPAAPQH